MATATKELHTKLVPQPPKEVTEATYTLVMTEQEAKTLRIVCASIAGIPETSRRGYMDSIGAALRLVGIANFHCAAKSGSIFFEPETGI